VESSTHEPLVRVSGVPELSPGDTIVSVDGNAAASVMADRSQYVSSSKSSAFRNAAETLLHIDGPTDYRLRDAAGVERDVMIDPATLPQSFPTYPPRQAGPLTDLGHAEFFYVNLEGTVLAADQVAGVIAGIDASQSVVLDMRGYPAVPSWTVI